MKASDLIKTECCGVGLLSSDKSDLVSKVEQLEKENQELQDRIDNALANAPLNREKLARKCFIGGLTHIRPAFPDYCERAWLKFKATEL